MIALVAIVDDDPAIRAGLSSLLRSEGYAIRLFESAESYLAALDGLGPHLLLTDIQMHGISGLELQAQLRDEQPSIPVIVMTAFPDPAVRERALAGGALCFLSKPFEAEELLCCLRRAART